MIAEPEAVLFDFDGTLAPNLDLPDMRRRVIELTDAYGVPEKVYADLYIVEVIEAAVAHLRTVRHPGADAYYRDAHQLILDIELESAARTRPFPGVPELLTELRTAGVKTGIVTRNCRQAVLSVFPEVLEHVDALHARGDADFLKPDLRHIRQNLDALAARAERSAIVGDGELDMRVGRALGMTCIGVLTGSSNRERLRAAGADVVLQSCLDLPAVLPPALDC